MILEWLDARIDIVTVLWLFPILFMFHDFEEILTVEKWAKQNKAHVFAFLPKSFHKYFASSFELTTLQFIKDVFWIYVIITIAAVLAVLFSFYYLLLMLLFIFFIHVFTHLAQAIYLKKYTPGVATSVILVLPYSVYAYYRLLQAGLISAGDIFWCSIFISILSPAFFLFLVNGRNRAMKRF